MNDPTRFIDLLPTPGKLSLADLIMLRVARFHIGFPELFEHRALLVMVTRPDVSKPAIDAFSWGL